MSVPARYNRNLHSLSEDECASLADKRAVVVGCGGLGGYCIEELARLGVGHLRAIDGDAFEESNLNRQILATQATLGQDKAQTAAARVLAVNPLVAVEPVSTLLDEGNAGALVEGAD